VSPDACTVKFSGARLESRYPKANAAAIVRRQKTTRALPAFALRRRQCRKARVVNYRTAARKISRFNCSCFRKRSHQCAHFRNCSGNSTSYSLLSWTSCFLYFRDYPVLSCLYDFAFRSSLSEIQFWCITNFGALQVLLRYKFNFNYETIRRASGPRLLPCASAPPAYGFLRGVLPSGRRFQAPGR
jgi:hypothetical protein